jgi:hypothetical protein
MQFNYGTTIVKSLRGGQRKYTEVRKEGDRAAVNDRMTNLAV